MKKPKIRFKGYQEDWEQRKLSDVVDSVGTGKSRFDKEGRLVSIRFSVLLL